MEQVRKGIVLRAPSVYRSNCTLFDEQLGKIEGILGRPIKLSHGTLLTYAVQKRVTSYYLQDYKVLEMPLSWASDNFLFFHHVLELCDYFMPWDAHGEGLFELMMILYTNPDSVRTKKAQKLFLAAFFKHLGIHTEVHRGKDWLRSCIEEHPQMLLLKTASFLKTLEAHEELA